MTDTAELALLLHRARRDARPVRQLSADAPTLTEADGYAIQTSGLRLRQAEEESPTGIKMGLTSKEKMRQVGVQSVIHGVLTTAMRRLDGGEEQPSFYIHPRIEPEIAFVLGRSLFGPVSPAEAMLAVEAVAPALEIIDSRYADFRFNLADVVADNASAAAYVLGDWASPATDLGNLGIELRVDGVGVQWGSSAAILGHPVRALVEASIAAERQGLRLGAGSVVLAGAATEAVPLRPGAHVQAMVQRLGCVSIRMAEARP